MKKKLKFGFPQWGSPVKLWRIMRIIIFILLTTVYAVSASTYAQVTRLNIDVEDQTIREVFDYIESNSEFVFLYRSGDLDLEQKVSVKLENAPIDKVLDETLKEESVEYSIYERQVIINKKAPEEVPAKPATQQEKLVVGMVVDVKGQPIPGATLMVEGTTNGTITDVDGRFVLRDLADNAVLICSFVGMKSVRVIIGSQTSLHLVMYEQAIGLDEIVAVGYGSQRKRDLTGSVVSVNTDELESLPVSTVGEAMQGRAAGVQIVSSGVPGSSPEIRIRGIGTINNSSPLYVIDGVPTLGGLGQLSMSDIQSIQVLKDASATAIYGSRGANGVVIVSTKLGQAAKSQIQFTANYGIQEATSLVDVLDAGAFASLHNEMMLNAGLQPNPANADPAALGKGTDWLDALFNTAAMQSYSLAYSGGNEKSRYYFSGNYFDQEGIVSETGFRRYTVKFNAESQVKDFIKFGNNLSLNHDIKEQGAYSIKNTMLALPTQAIYNEDGTYAGPEARPSWDGDITNPIGQANLIESSTKGYNIIGSLFAEVELMNGLTFKSTVGLEANFWFDRTWSPKYNWRPSPQENSYLFEQTNRSITWNWDNILTWKQTFNEVHKLTVMAGTSAQENRFKFSNGSIQNFASDFTQQLGNGTEQPTVDGNESEWSLMSYIGRINYGFNDKYLVTATVRRDGSSRFGSGNKWGIFPSGSVAWRISEEDFFQNVTFVDDLKLRAGFGITGNQEIGNYSFASGLSTIKYNFNDQVVTAVVPNVMPNPNVQWESQKQTNIGIDATLFDQKVVVTLDGYIKNTEDMLVPMSVPISTGYSDVVVPSINAGKISNKGIELTISSRNLDGEFCWSTDFNISYNENEVKSLNDTIPMITGNNFDFNFAVARITPGHAVNEFYGFVTDGIFQNQAEVDAHAIQVPGLDPYNRTSAGDIRFMDLNSDGVINDDDRTYIGDPNPDFIFALNNRFAYKGFEMSVFLQGVYGVDLFNANRIWNEGMAVAVNQSTETLHRWQGEGTSNSIPRAVFNDPNKNTRASTRWIEDGSYLRVKNVTLAYNLPERMIAKAKLTAAKIYLTANNLFTFTDYKGFDPEVSVSGIDHNTYPVTRTVSMGVNLSF